MGFTARNGRAHPILPPEDFRQAAVRYMARDLGLDDAGRRYSTLVAGAADALAAALGTLREEVAETSLDFTEESLARLDAAIHRRAARGGIPPELTVGIGAYLGECLRIGLRGSWLVRFDPKGGRGFRASTVHFDPGLKDHGGFESDVFAVAETCVRPNGRRHTLLEHYRYARSLMERPGAPAARKSRHGVCCRPAAARRAR